jgi:spore maturation protein CgeB
MSRKLRIAYFAHSLRSDWNNGNAHFLRGLLRGLGQLGHEVTIFEPGEGWSIVNLRQEPRGEQSLRQFSEVYPDLRVSLYEESQLGDAGFWASALEGTQIVIFHEWNPPELAHLLLRLRDCLRFRLLFHDTHHRASSSPEQIRLFGIPSFDGVLAFGNSLRVLYRERFAIHRVWTLHEAADTSVFKPASDTKKQTDVLWIGNWGDDERSREIDEFLLCPAKRLPARSFMIHGVRYPAEGLAALRSAGVQYAGYLPNLDAPAAYAAARLTVHIPRQQYTTAMLGIPTIRVFEALACGIPLISAPWQDTEALFREGDYMAVRNGAEMLGAIESLLGDAEAARQQAARGLETVLARHTCRHRAEQLSLICEEVLS